MSTSTPYCSPVSNSRKHKHCQPDKQAANMSGGQLEAWWGLSPEDLAIVQADPYFKSALSHATIGILAASMFQKLLALFPALQLHALAIVLTS